MDSFTAVWDEYIEAHEGEIGASEETIQKDRPKVMEQCRGYFRYLQREGIEIVGREVPVTAEIEGVKFAGIVDSMEIHRDTPKGMLEIVDFKTGAKWPFPCMNRKLQFGLYYLMADQMGLKPNRFFLGHTQDLNLWKTDGKKAVKGQQKGNFYYPIIIEPGDMPVVIDNIKAILRGIEAKAFFTNPTSGLCKLCEYQRLCPAFRVGVENGNVLEKHLVNDKALEAKLMESITKETK